MSSQLNMNDLFETSNHKTLRRLETFDSILKAEYDSVNSIVAQYVKEAKLKGDGFDKKIEHTPEYIQFKRDLDFIHELELLVDSEVHVKTLDKQIRDGKEMIRKAI